METQKPQKTKSVRETFAAALLTTFADPLVKNIARPKSLESENPISKASADNSEEKPREIGPVQEKHSNDSQRVNRVFSLLLTLLIECFQADLLERVKKNSGKIQYVDAIERKKTEGAYGKWRKNYMKLCKCNRTDCDCTSTPANQSTLGFYIFCLGVFYYRSIKSALF